MTHFRPLLLTVVIAVSSPALANQPGAPDPDPSGVRPAPPAHQRPQPMQLTDNQKAQMKALREEHQTRARPLQTAYRNDIQALRAATENHAPPADMAARRDAVARSREALRAESERFRLAMQAILTPAQREQVNRHAAPPGPAPASPPSRPR